MVFYSAILPPRNHKFIKSNSSNNNKPQSQDKRLRHRTKYNKIQIDAQFCFFFKFLFSVSFCFVLFRQPLFWHNNNCVYSIHMQRSMFNKIIMQSKRIFILFLFHFLSFAVVLWVITILCAQCSMLNAQCSCSVQRLKLQRSYVIFVNEMWLWFLSAFIFGIQLP